MSVPHLNNMSLALLEEQYHHALTEFINVYLFDRTEPLGGKK